MIINVIVFATYFFKNKFPVGISKLFKKLFSFEISKKVSLVIIIVLLVTYVSASAGELSTQEDLGDYGGVKERLETWSIDTISGLATCQIFSVIIINGSVWQL